MELAIELIFTALEAKKKILARKILIDPLELMFNCDTIFYSRSRSQKYGSRVSVEFQTKLLIISLLRYILRGGGRKAPESLAGRFLLQGLGKGALPGECIGLLHPTILLLARLFRRFGASDGLADSVRWYRPDLDKASY